MSTGNSEIVVKPRAVMPADARTLPARYYTDPEYFARELDTFFRERWICVGRTEEVATPGQFVRREVAGDSIIVTRSSDGILRAFHNVCRHRGSRLLKEPCGQVGNIVCGYHQWTYRTDGSLIFAESQPPTFDHSRFGLRPVHVKNVAGLIFICLDENPPADFDEVAQFVEPFLGPYGLSRAKVAHQIDLPEEGNWKLVMENNRECQHCDGAHPELVSAYFPLFGYSEDDITPRLRPAFERYQVAATDLERACAVRRFPRDDRRELDGRETGFQLSHLALDGAGISFGTDGAQLCTKLMGSLTEPKFGDLSWHMQPNSRFHFLSDHAVVFRVLPLSADKSIVRTTWLVHPDAVEGVDYDVESLTAVWRATNNQDRELVIGTQNGVTNPSYLPGPYSLVEDDVEAFINWYIQRVEAYLGS